MRKWPTDHEIKIVRSIIYEEQVLTRQRQGHRVLSENLVIKIEDDGVGISKTQMSELFHPLFTTKAKGNGLGLTVCKTIVEGHGGKISAINKKKGSIFIVEIPNS